MTPRSPSAEAAEIGLCHIQIQFTSPPVLLEFQDERPVADRFAAAASRMGAEVTIDDELRAGLAPLPCRRLWR
jgi:hypothetical protein